MGNIGFLYRVSIALSCILLMLASIACTGWFFYSWLGGTPGIVGAVVGCAVQLMAYGFSGVIVHQANGLLRAVLFLLIASALSLSVLSSYATLNGYFSALQNDREARELSASQKQRAVQAAIEQRVELVESMSRDVAIGTEAADQGLSEKYRTQASQFLSSNASTRSEIESQIEKLEAMAESNLLATPDAKKGSPIDGLSNVLGGKNTAIYILCAWLAIMFDALPIAGITLFETRNKNKPKQTESIEEVTETETFIFQSLPDEPNHNPRLLTDESGRGDEFKVLTNICSHDLQATKAFYVDLLGFEVKFESDWYLQLSSPLHPDSEFGVIQFNHDLVPQEYQGPPNGMYMTFLVPNVDSSYARAIELGVDIIQEPRNEFYGQRRFLAREPGGCMVDICSPWESA